MMRSFITAGLLALGVALPGCLWLTGGTAALVATSDGGSGGGEAATRPPADPVLVAGPFLALEGTPLDVVVGDFFPDADGDIDVAVVYADRLFVTIVPGRGDGGFDEPFEVGFSRDASNTLAATRLPRPGGGDDLVVTTGTSLEWIHVLEDGRAQVASTSDIASEPSVGAVTWGYFDADDIADVAASSAEFNAVQIFRAAPDGAQRLEYLFEFGADSPRAIAAANFDADEAALWDLAVLEVTSEGPQVSLWTLRPSGRYEMAASSPIDDATVLSGAALLARDEGGRWAAPDPLTDSLFPPDLGAPLDDFIDLVVVRKHGVSRILITDDGNGQPWMRRHPRGTGSPGSRPVDGDLIRLDRRAETPFPYWDVVSLDSRPNWIAATAADERNGLEIGPAAHYPLPGQGRALAVADFNGDGLEDIAGVSVSPAVLTVLLSHPPVDQEPFPAVPEAVEDPFFYAFGTHLGEVPASGGGIASFGIGRLGPGSGLPFLAARRRDGNEVLVLQLGSPAGPLEAHSMERYPLGDVALDDLLVGDFDGANGDDLLVLGSRTAAYLLTSTGRRSAEGESFVGSDAPLVDLAAVGGLPESIAAVLGADASIRVPAVGRIDGDEFLDLALPLTVDGLDRDFVVILLGPGSPVFSAQVGVDVFFVETLDDPRHAAIADFNGDSVPDLAVACERSNAIRVHFGDPSARGRFIDAESSPLRPLTLPGIEDDGVDCRVCAGTPEVEFVVAEPRVEGEGPARFLVVANSRTVAVHPNLTTASDRPIFGPPALVEEGTDPEQLLLSSSYSLTSGPSLIVVDEDAPDRDKVIFLDYTADGEVGAGVNPWVRNEDAVLSVEGAPDGAAVLEFDGRLFLAVALKGSDSVNVYESSSECPVACLRRTPELRFDAEDVVGNASGLSVWRDSSPRDDWLIASIVEDGDPGTGTPVISWTTLSGASSEGALRDIGSRSHPHERALYPSLVDPVGVVCGRFPGPGAGLAIVDFDAEADQCRVVIDAGRGGGELRELDAVVKGSFVGVERLDRAGTDGDALLLATHEQIVLLEPGGNRRTVVARGDEEAAIHRMAHGWLRTRRRDLPDPASLDVVFVRADKLLLAEMATGDVHEIGRAVSEDVVLGCGDLDGDGFDDLVVAESRPFSTAVVVRRGPDLELTGEVAFDRSLQPVDVAFPDLDGLGHRDIAVGTARGDVLVFFGNGTALFTERAITVAHAGPSIEALTAADLDGDGADEILASSAVPGLSVLRGLRPSRGAAVPKSSRE